MAGATVRAKSATRGVWTSSHHRELLPHRRLSTGVSGNSSTDGVRGRQNHSLRPA